jgi:N-methylhydantoinase B
MPNIILVTTEGFADVLSLGRQNRPDPYALHVGPSPWLLALPDAQRLQVACRVNAAGRVTHELTSDAVQGLLRDLRAQPLPPTAIAVCLLHAPRNPVHEIELQAALGSAFPGVPVVCSHTLPGDGHGEFERTLATVRRAAVGEPSLAHEPWIPACAGMTQGVGNADMSGAFITHLQDIADQMHLRLVECAVSSVVKEAMDCAAAIFLPDGRLLAQARTLPLLLGSLATAVNGVLSVFDSAAMQDGDGFVCNDPWSGGTHLPDLLLMRPVMVNGHVQALLACYLHHQDVGGITPGSVPTDATSIHQEGLRIPPMQIYRGGVIDAALLRLLRANSRMPDNLAGDLAAQWAALNRGDERLRAWIGAGAADFKAQATRLLAGSEQATRAALRGAPDGHYRFNDALDGDGITDAPVKIAVELRKTGDSLVIDLSGCADQTTGPVNASPGAVRAALSYFAHMLAPQAPATDGSMVPITLVTRPGSIVDPTFPAAVNARTNLVKLLANALLGAWAQCRPGDSPAPNAGVAVVLSLAGQRSDGQRWLMTEIIASAAGGAPWEAGGSGVSTDVGNARNTPAEVIERQAPMEVQGIGLRRGSGGAGLHQGGMGVVRRYRLLDGSGTISYRGERHHTPAQGAAGGQPGRCGSARIERADGGVEPLPAKSRSTWSAGDVLVIETAGAGGWGTPPT